jgi:hypothetical protein
VFQPNNDQKITQSLKEQLSNSSDVVFSEINTNEVTVQKIYLKSLSDEKKIQEYVTIPFFEIGNEKGIEKYIQSIPNGQEEKETEKVLIKLLNGSLIVILNEKIFSIDVKREQASWVSEATVETVIQGPQNALSESIDTNINLIRNRYQQASLKIEDRVIGDLSKTKISLVYDDKKVDPKVLKDIKDSLSKVKMDVLQAAGQLGNKLSRQKRSLFPTMMITERPDRIAFNLAQGKVVILIAGTPFALVAPAVFYDFISSMEDIYQSYWISRFLVFIRYISIFISLVLPAFYVGVSAFSPELFRVELALSIAGSRVSVPYPAFLEVLFMLLMMELLTEASIRLPKAIGSTATTVGGLILGQAATQAGLVSNIMIIIVAAVAISNFTVPINPMSFAIRVTKYVILALTTLLGTIGLVLGVMGLVVYLANLESFGQPYLKLFMRDRLKGNN